MREAHCTCGRLQFRVGEFQAPPGIEVSLPIEIKCERCGHIIDIRLSPGSIEVTERFRVPVPQPQTTTYARKH